MSDLPDPVDPQMARDREMNLGGPEFSVALTHTWSWFSQHANQRMQAVNFYLVAAAFLTAAYGTTAAAERWPAAAVIGAAGVVVSLAFNQLDARTRELVRAAEPALSRMQSALVSAGYIGLAMLDSSQENRKAPSYRTVITLLTWLGVAAFGAGAIVAIIVA
jgi:hypothetical protein